MCQQCHVANGADKHLGSFCSQMAVYNSASNACRGLAVKAAVAKRGGRGRGRGRKGGRGRGGAANGTSHAHTNGNAEGSSSEAEASDSGATDGNAE